jgi:hypothetical protein
MIRWFKKHPNTVKGIVGTWAFFATAASLILGFITYQDSSALDRLEAREKLDKFMAEARINYSARCVESTERLRPIWQERLDVLLGVAKVDADKAPYNSLCKYFSPPRAVGGFSAQYKSSKSSAKYSNWGSFIGKEEKMATLWVGEIPVVINVTSGDFNPLKSQYEKMREELKICESKEQSKPENTFVKITCVYDIDEKNNVVMSSVTSEIN